MIKIQDQKNNNERHLSVLLKESIEALSIKSYGVYVDCTLGNAGHSSEILKLASEGRLICFDQDENVIEKAKSKLSEISDNFTIINKNFSYLEQTLQELKIRKVDGILIDLGVSSMQLDEGDRGFSYRFDNELDMRMDKRNTLTAKHVVNTYSESDLSYIFKTYGDEKFATRIAKKICEIRKVNEVATTYELVDIIKSVLPAKVMRDKHPAKKVFQALRIEVNNEIGALKEVLMQSLDVLEEGGRLVVITFHSLEERVCKQFFKAHETKKVSGKMAKLPLMDLETRGTIRRVYAKSIIPTEEEQKINRRSVSARMRVFERINVNEEV